jgi:hypothetical protein
MLRLWDATAHLSPGSLALKEGLPLTLISLISHSVQSWTTLMLSPSTAHVGFPRQQALPGASPMPQVRPPLIDHAVSAGLHTPDV